MQKERAEQCSERRIKDNIVCMIQHEPSLGVHDRCIPQWTTDKQTTSWGLKEGRMKREYARRKARITLRKRDERT